MTTASHVAEAIVARNLVAILEEFRHFETRMEVTMCLVFLHVASRPGIKIKELEKALGLSVSAVSRNVLALSSRHYLRDPEGKFLPGLDVVVTTSDPMDSRAKLVTLTPRGRNMFERITLLFNSNQPVAPARRSA